MVRSHKRTARRINLNIGLRAYYKHAGTGFIVNGYAIGLYIINA